MKRSALVFALGLAVATIVLKLANPQLPENFAIVYALALFCGCYLSGVLRWALPVATLLFTDIAGHFVDDYLLGTYATVAMVLNYVGLSAMTGIGALLRRNPNLVVVGIGSLVGAGAFFLLSNFGAFLDPRMGYESSFAGLIDCYVKGYEFARGTFSSSLIFSLACFGAYQQWLGMATQPATETAAENQIAS